MLVNEFKAIAKECNLGFRYGSASEINMIMDSIKPEEFPILIYFAPVTANDTISPNRLVKTSLPFNAAILQRQKSDTVDKPKVDVQTVIDNLRDRARNFIYKVNEAEFIQRDSPGVESVSYPTLYDQYDDLDIGVAIECTIPIQLNSTYCKIEKK